MRLVSMTLLLSASAAIWFVPDTARASPASGLRTLPSHATQAQPIAYRCWWEDGERHCRSVGGHHMRYGAGSPDDYRVGTAEWYRAMERDDRLNRGSRGR